MNDYKIISIPKNHAGLVNARCFSTNWQDCITQPQ